MKLQKSTSHFVNVTEIAGQQISFEQLDRMCHRYHWALQFCQNKDVLEIACGAGQGLGLLNQCSKSLAAGDVSSEVLSKAVATYGTSISLDTFTADKIPLPNNSVDTVLLFEAIYYIEDLDACLTEAKRVLRPGGHLLIVTANKDLWDFNPSPFSTRYFNVPELDSLLASAGFKNGFWGYVDVTKVGFRQRLLRPAKAIARWFGLIPSTMKGKELLKRLVFGRMTTMPGSIADIEYDFVNPDAVPSSQPCHAYKVIYCAAEFVERN